MEPREKEVCTPDLALCVTPDYEELELRRGTNQLNALPVEEDEGFAEAQSSEKRTVYEDEVVVKKRSRVFTFVVNGEEFPIEKPFLAIHSPVWAARFQADPTLVRAELPGEADTFCMFVDFLEAVEGASEVTAKNVLPLLHWSKEFGVDYIAALCEAFLLSRPPAGMEPTELLEIAARHNMPLLYSRATEVVAQGMHWVEVSDSTDGGSDAFRVGGIREDLISAHISMGLMRNDGEMHRRHRFADQTVLEEPKQRARLLWKTRSRFVPPPADPAELDWKSLQICWPHHSLRKDDWTVVPCETQPTMPMRARGIAIGRTRR